MGWGYKDGVFHFARTLFYGFLLVFAVTDLAAQTEYGLAFASHEVTKDQRTSLCLTPDAPLVIDDDFQLRFDVSYQRLTNAFGYILRIVANDSLNIDFISSPTHVDFHDLNFIVGNSPAGIHYDFEEVNLTAGQWNEVVITFSRKRNSISFSWNGKTQNVACPASQLQRFRFFFGANDFGKFNTSDVPPVCLRNIQILEKNRPALVWQLKKHNTDEVYDNSLQHVATVKNPAWLIDQHIKWVHRKEFSLGKYPSVTFDGSTNTLYATDAHAVYTLDVGSGKLDRAPLRQGNPVNTEANQLVFREGTRQLINYDVFSNKLFAYDAAQRRWMHTDTAYYVARYWHNNKFFNPYDSSLYSFGGYGHYTYYNEFFRYDTRQQKWAAVKTSGTIPPRYLGALGLNTSKEKALIFGGYGSISGKQELSPQSYYDLYTFDLRTHVVQKVWEMENHTAENLVFSNSLVPNERDSCFYVLSFPKNKYQSYIKLQAYDLHRPVQTTLADSIPFLFHDIQSFCDLFFSRATNELIAVTVHKENDQYKAHVYSINYPPLRTGDVVQGVPPRAASANVPYYLLYIIAGAAILGLAYLFVVRRKRKPALEAIVPPSVAPAALATPHIHPAADIMAEPTEDKRSMINLFGGFQVFDKTGHDITPKFTTTLKELLVLILLHSVKFEKGISTTVLQEYLWPDKDETSARNNRNVNLKKLRALLEEIGDISIENNNAYLHMNIGADVFCDYQTTYRILNSGNDESARMEILLKYVKRGSLLPNMQTAWLDSFKSDISNKLIDVLLAYSSRLDMHKNDKTLLDIADSIFNYDAINQEAMILKCSVLNKKGKHSLAKNWYDHFVKDYMNLYGESYPKTFDEVVS
jgi:DNA-binding SARP family transcriptional activator